MTARSLTGAPYVPMRIGSSWVRLEGWTREAAILTSGRWRAQSLVRRQAARTVAATVAPTASCWSAAFGGRGVALRRGAGALGVAAGRSASAPARRLRPRAAGSSRNSKRVLADLERVAGLEDRPAARRCRRAAIVVSLVIRCSIRWPLRTQMRASSAPSVGSSMRTPQRGAGADARRACRRPRTRVPRSGPAREMSTPSGSPMSSVRRCGSSSALGIAPAAERAMRVAHGVIRWSGETIASVAGRPHRRMTYATATTTGTPTRPTTPPRDRQQRQAAAARRADAGGVRREAHRS